MKLSPRQLEVLTLISRGYSRKEIAGEIGRSESAVRRHVEMIRLKLGARSLAHAVALWVRLVRK